MARGASSRKTPPETPKLRTPAHGRGKLQSGNPGNKGGGRKPNEFYDLCEKATADPTLWADAKVKQPLGTLGMAAEYTFGKPVQGLQHTGEVTFRVVYDDELGREDA